MWICIAHRREHASDALPLTVCWRWSPPPIPQCREIGSSPWFNKAACATLESRIIASVNLDVMVRWPVFSAGDKLLIWCWNRLWNHVTVAGPAAARPTGWTIGRTFHGCQRVYCIDRRVEENVPLWSTWQDLLENLINSDVSTVCAPLWIFCSLYIAVNKSSCK